MTDLGNEEGQRGCEQVHGLTASVRTKSSWQTAKLPHSFHQALLPVSRSQRKTLLEEGRKEEGHCQKSFQFVLNRISFFTICL